MMDEREVRAAIYQLVEAQIDQDTARAQLESFTRSNDPPRPPSEFDSLEIFLNFYSRKRDYAETLRGIELEGKVAQRAHEDAGHTLQDILPENTPLRFTYAGGREDLEGLRCVIVNQDMGGQRQVIISSMSRPAES
jgi:hypothetical protein